MFSHEKTCVYKQKKLDRQGRAFYIWT